MGYLEKRRQVLFAFAGLVVAYVRHFFQYDQYGFSSFEVFLGSWIAHYFFLALTMLAAHWWFHQMYAFFFGKEFLKHSSASDIKATELSTETAMVYFAIVVIFCSAIAFLVAHIPVEVFASRDDF